MKPAIIFLLFLLFNSAVYSAKINSYNIDVKFDNIRKQLYIDVIVDLKHEKSKSIELLLSSKCTISSITDLHENNILYNLKGKDTIMLTLDESSLKDSNIIIKFNYTYSTGDDTLIFLDRGNRWYPMIAENISAFLMNIDVPKNYIAVSAGELISELADVTNKYTFSSNITVFKIPIIIAPSNYYSVKQDNCGKIKTFVYYLPKHNESTIDSMLTDICSTISYFSLNFGDYPFDRFNIAETPFFEGTNLGSSIITAGSGNIAAFSSGYKEWFNLAIASQWIGAGVFPKLFCKGFWFLSLSIPHYLRLMYLKDTQGEEAFIKQLNYLSEKYSEFAGTENDIPIFDIDFPDTKEKGILIYGKGVLILNEIHKLMGEPAWINMLKDFHENYYGRIILMDDFIACINKFDPMGKCSSYLTKMLSEKGTLN